MAEWASAEAMARYSMPTLQEIPECRLQRALAIMGPHDYVSFSLDYRGRAVHLTRLPEGGVFIAEVAAGVMPPGARYANPKQRLFPMGISPVPVTDNARMITTLETFLERRGRRPLIVQVSPQGWHENLPSKLELGMDDTGGQNKYINESGLAMADLGYTVVNATRGGPNHPTSYESRCGMHYSHTYMDLLFLEDGIPKTFIFKEYMFAPPGWQVSGRVPPNDHVLHPLAKSLHRHLQKEPQGICCTMIGHYADGGTVACLARAMQRCHITVWFNPHSLGAEKEARMIAAGTSEENMEALRITARIEYERFALEETDGIVCTSQPLADALEKDYVGRAAHHVMVPGINPNLYRPRKLKRRDSLYMPVWRKLSSLSGQPFSVLKKAKIIMEVSRTARSKVKDTVLRAFAELLTPERRAANSLFLVMNIGVPSHNNVGPENGVAEELTTLVNELDIHPWVISKEHFTAKEVLAMHQLLFAFVTGANSEPWGMTVQQAAACGQLIITTTVVPCAIDALTPNGLHKLADLPNQRVMEGDGALFFEPNDYRAAAAALQWALDNDAKVAAIAERAHHLVAQRYNWHILVREWLQRAGYLFNADGIVLYCPSSFKTRTEFGSNKKKARSKWNLA